MCKNTCVFLIFEASHCPPGWIWLAVCIADVSIFRFAGRCADVLLGQRELGFRQKSKPPGAWSSEISKAYIHPSYHTEGFPEYAGNRKNIQIIQKIDNPGGSREIEKI